MRGNSNRTIQIIAAVVATAVITSAVTLFITNRGAGGLVVLSAEEYEKYSDIAALGEVIERVETEFYAEVPDNDTMLAGAANGVLSTLNDQYAHYYTAEEYEEYLSGVNGEYNGIGMLIAQPDDVGSAVLEVYEGYPASKAGIKAGDILTHIDSTPTANVELDELKAIILEKQNAKMRLTLLRDGESFEVTLKAESITVKHVDYRLLSEGTGYISISMFTGNCSEEFEKAVRELENSGMKSLVIDLRNNPGGSLTDVLEIADVLLEKDMRIVSVGPANSKEEEVYEAKGRGIEVPLAVIVNQNSASASEILAAAVQENGVGCIVGTNTYGKGIVQTTMPITESGGWLKITTDAYYTPKGNYIHEKGVAPDIYVELPEEYQNAAIDSINQQDDTQLWAALDYVRKKAE